MWIIRALLIYMVFLNGSEGLEIGALCYNGNTEGRCKATSQCDMRFMNTDAKDVYHCGFDIRDEIICCPLLFSERKLNSSHLAGLLYYDEDYIKIEQRCTAIIVAKNLLLAGQQCFGNNHFTTPIAAIVGSLQLDEKNTTQQLDIKTISDNGIDFKLVYLEQHMNFSDASDVLSLSDFCTSDEMQVSDNPYFASGWGQASEQSCGFFQITMVQQASGCGRLTVQRSQNAHNYRCFLPMMNSLRINNKRIDGCTQCLIGSGSVLHMRRSDGSSCVAGVAMPFGVKNCEPLHQEFPIYFAMLSKEAVDHFFV